MALANGFEPLELFEEWVTPVGCCVTCGTANGSWAALDANGSRALFTGGVLIGGIVGRPPAARVPAKGFPPATLGDTASGGKANGSTRGCFPFPATGEDAFWNGVPVRSSTRDASRVTLCEPDPKKPEGALEGPGASNKSTKSPSREESEAPLIASRAASSAKDAARAARMSGSASAAAAIASRRSATSLNSSFSASAAISNPSSRVSEIKETTLGRICLHRSARFFTKGLCTAPGSFSTSIFASAVLKLDTVSRATTRSECSFAIACGEERSSSAVFGGAAAAAWRFASSRDARCARNKSAACLPSTGTPSAGSSSDAYPPLGGDPVPPPCAPFRAGGGPKFKGIPSGLRITPTSPPKSIAPRALGGEPAGNSPRASLRSIMSASSSASWTAARIAAASAGSIRSKLAPMISAVVRRGMYRGCAAAAETCGDALTDPSARDTFCRDPGRGMCPGSPCSGGNRTPFPRTCAYTSCKCGCRICCAHSRISTSVFSCTSTAVPLLVASRAISCGTSLAMTIR
mmetsp:Transcript_4380/g.14597  ORF Transcript_4380/g.14597 Transcript_4380/m.14597 type:complete len:520 (+) Transcript_4380:436-1995(+)